MTNQQVSDDDIKALEELKKSLEDENTAIDGEIVRMKDEVESQTADDVRIIEETSKELDDLKDQADEEENRGQIAQAKQNIDQL